MKTTLVLLLALAGLASCAVIKQHLHMGASLRERLIKEGTFGAFLAKHQFIRSHGASKAAVGTQPFTDYWSDVLLTGDIALGTPYQNFTVILDTNSADLWLIDYCNCNNDACFGWPTSGYGKKRYNVGESSTFKNSTYAWIAGDHTGNVGSGYVAVDRFNLAGLVVDSQALGVATKVADFFGYQPADGMMGLAWPALSDIGASSPVWNLLDQLDQPIFTMWIDRNAKPQAPNAGGLVTYGALDTAHCEAQVDYVSLSSLTYWQFPMTRFAIGSYSSNARQEAYADSGASWFGGPTGAVQGIIGVTGAKYDAINYQYVLPCAGSYPNMDFTIGGKTFSITPEEYVLDAGLGKGNCVLALFEMMSTGGFGPDWIFGNVWNKIYCNVHDVGQRRIGFARAK